MEFKSSMNELSSATNFDENDPLRQFRDEFYFPQHNGKDQLYFAGHSLGLMPKKANDYVMEELEAWKKYGVEGHFKSGHPWYSYHENLTSPSTRLVGANDEEVVVMNSLTANLHLMLVSFYRPTAKRYKILIENNTFPSDKYAVDSQARFHGYDPSETVVELKPEEGELTVSEDKILETIKETNQLLIQDSLTSWLSNSVEARIFDYFKLK